MRKKKLYFIAMEKKRVKIRRILEDDNCIDFERGRALKVKLHELAKKCYTPQREPNEYFKFMNENPCSFSINHPQCTNHPYYFTFFSVKSQHVQGDCLEECLDLAMGSDEENK